MKTYRFLMLVKRSGLVSLGILLCATFLLLPQVLPAQAAPSWPEGEEPLLEQAPPATAEAPAAPLEAAAARTAAPCAALVEYMPGETLDQIALRYSITVEELRTANPWLVVQPLQSDSVLCIPSIRVIREHCKAKLYAYLFMGHLAIYGEGFPEDYRYNVRVMANRSDIWYKIGSLRASNGGIILTYFKLPIEIRYPRRLKVCLKEVDTSWKICTQAEVVRY